MTERDPSRRKFLQIGAAASFAFVIPGSLRSHFASEVSPQDQEITKEALEKEFNVKLKTLRQVYQEQGREYPEIKLFRDVPKQWEGWRLTFLRKLLLLLPPHFHKERKEYPVTMILSNTYYCSDKDQGGPLGYVEVDHSSFKPESAETALTVFTHLLTHVITPKEVIYHPNPINPRLPPILEIKSPWFPLVEDILGGSYLEKGRQLWYKVSEEKTRTKDPEKIKFYNDLRWGLNRIEDPYELIAVFGQHHLEGRAYMDQMYGEFFSKEQLDKLYLFTKDTIFRGWEYPRFPV